MTVLLAVMSAAIAYLLVSQALIIKSMLRLAKLVSDRRENQNGEEHGKDT